MTDADSIVTVDGAIAPGDLGVTLPHEHLFIDLWESWGTLPDSAYERSIAESPVAMEELWWVRRNAMSHRDNMRLDGFEAAVDELSRYHRAGGDAVVDVTPKNTGGDPRQVRAVARETGVTVVQGTAHYVGDVHPERVREGDIESIAAEFESDVREGIGDTGVRAGIVGEIGVTGHIHDGERKVLRAGARAARRTGAPLNVHPPGKTPESRKGNTYPSSKWGMDILDIVEEEGLPPERVVISHIDRTINEDLEAQKALADRGAFVEYDRWGMERYLGQFDPPDSFPSDVQRGDRVCELIDAGHASKLLFSHDVCMKMQLTAYGGFGYEHVVANVLPMLADRGVSRETLTEIVEANPRRLLTFAEPAG